MTGRPFHGLTSLQVAEWMAYYQLEPWGNEPEEWRHGAWMAMYANAHRGKDSDPVRYPWDFSSYIEKPDMTQTPKQQQTFFSTLKDGLNQKGK